MHKALEGVHPKVRIAFRDIIIEIAKQIHDDVCEENFYALVRFAVEGWIEKNKSDLPITYTPEMRQILYEITCDALLVAYKFDPEKLTPETGLCLLRQ